MIQVFPRLLFTNKCNICPQLLQHGKMIQAARLLYATTFVQINLNIVNKMFLIIYFY